MISIFFSAADAASSGSWPIVFSVLTLNVAIFIDFLHLSRFVLVLGSMSVLLDTVVRFMSSVECVFCFSVLSDVV